MIKMIAAVSQNGVIGKDNEIPWNYPEDKKFFHEMTKESVVIMGRKTFASMNYHHLPKRRNIVITSQVARPPYRYHPHTESYSTLNEAIEMVSASAFFKDAWLIGGADIYQEGMAYASEIYLTIIPEVVSGENLVKFPWINPTIFKFDSVTPFETDDRLKLVKYIRI